MLPLLLALQVAVSPAPADSTPRITLGDALQRAAQLDPNYVAALGQVDNAVWARRSAFAVFILPSVTLGANVQKSLPAGFSAVPFQTVVTAQVTARYDLFTGGQKIAELSRSAAALEGAHAGELVARFSTAFFTESDYYAVLADEELDRVAHERVRRADEQLGIARARVTTGAAVPTDSLQLRLELTRAEVGQLTQASLLRLARLELGRRVGEPGPVDAAPLDTAPAPELPITLADAISQAAAQGPQYRVAEANERAASAVFRSTLGAYLPHATLSLTGVAFDTVIHYPSIFKQTTLALGISFPLWDNGQREILVTRARVNRDVARAIRQDMDRGVQHDVTAAYDTYNTSRASAALALEGDQIARENFRVQQSRYQAGATTILDLLQAQADLDNAEALLVQARYTTRLALAGLEAILGRRLFPEPQP
jgi:outer membrane protein TolC